MHSCHASTHVIRRWDGMGKTANAITVSRTSRRSGRPVTQRKPPDGDEERWQPASQPAHGAFLPAPESQEGAKGQPKNQSTKRIGNAGICFGLIDRVDSPTCIALALPPLF